MKDRPLVLLTGASGTMGFEAFRLLWNMRDRYDLVLLVRPSAKNKRTFRRYELAAGIAPFRGPGVASGRGLKIVWGDALNRADLEEACRGIHWCLHTMALISPGADRDPEMAYRVNSEATRNLVEIIEEGDPENTRFVHIGSVAQYGDRFPPIHVGRTGDPLIPSLYDHYALSKIDGELAVMESRIRHRVSLRQTFIMIPGIFSLMDPIMFHQPFHSMMETITARDAGRALVACLEVPGDSGFWGNFYNLSGGPGCRMSYLEFLDRLYRMLGIDYRRVMERNWFALKNFHMQYYEDADRLNSFLRHWEGGEQMADYFDGVWKAFPAPLKMAAWCSKRSRPFRWVVERATYLQLKRMAGKKEGPLYWVRHHDQGKMEAFFGSCRKWKEIPGWEVPLTMPGPDGEYRRLEHGFDESGLGFGVAQQQKATGDEATTDHAARNMLSLALADLVSAVRFRGGSLEGSGWDGDLDEKLEWKCCQDHRFSLTPRTVLLGGHWCRECIAPPWDYGAFAEKNRFAAQVLSPFS